MQLLKQMRFTLPLLIFILIFILLWRGLTLHPSQVPSPLINKSIPTFELPVLNGNKTLSNKDFIGHVSLLNVWATWCYACEEEHAVLVELAKTHAVTFYGLDYKDDRSSATTWLKQRGNPYTLIGFDRSGQAAIDWGVYGTPETFIIDKKGIIRYKQIGPITAEVWTNELEPIIRQLKNEPV